MANNIASTTFTTGPDDSVEVVDVYKSTPPDRKPSVTGSLKNLAEEASKNILKKDNLAVDIVESTTVKGGKVVHDKEVGLSRLKGATGDLSSPMDDVKESLKDKALDVLGFKDEKPGQDKDAMSAVKGSVEKSKGIKDKLTSKKNIKVIINDVEHLMSNADLSSAQGVASMLEAVTESESIKVLDLESQFAVFQTVLNEANRLGIPEAIDLFRQKIDDEEERKRQLLRMLRFSFMSTDYGVINEAIDLVKPAGVLARVPDAISLFITFYKKPKDLKNKNYGAERTKIKTLLNTLNNKWDKYVRNGVEITNLEPFTYMSNDFYDIMVNDNVYQDIVMFAREYPSRNLRQLIISSFPNTPFPEELY